MRKVHGRSKPALKHSRVCEEEQEMPPQSTRSGTPSFEGRHARRQQGLHRQDQHSSTHKEFMPWILSGTGAKMYQQPHLQLG